MSAALEIGDRPGVEARLERRATSERARAGRRTRSGGRSGTPARRSPPGGSGRDRRDGRRRATPTAPAGRRPEFPRRGTAQPSRSASPGESVVRGRVPGFSDEARPSSSQNICARVPRGHPSAGMTGELCSQPPLGVAEIMFPKRSAMSRCTVPRPGSPEPTVASTAWRLGSRPSPGSVLGGRLLRDERASLGVVLGREQRLERHVLRVSVERRRGPRRRACRTRR